MAVRYFRTSSAADNAACAIQKQWPHLRADFRPEQSGRGYYVRVIAYARDNDGSWRLNNKTEVKEFLARRSVPGQNIDIGLTLEDVQALAGRWQFSGDPERAAQARALLAALEHNNRARIVCEVRE